MQAGPEGLLPDIPGPLSKGESPGSKEVLQEEASGEGSNEGRLSEENDSKRDRTDRIILKMAAYTDVGVNDILYILSDLTEDGVREKIQSLVFAGLLLEKDSPEGLRYRKAG